jgi:tRNA-Thr(GGU) m(6)t(6)A37 methyltransferase TsaA
VQFVFEPIALVRSPFTDRVSAPRQATVAPEVAGEVEFFPGRGFEHALEGLGAWDKAWLIFVFHKNVEQGRGFRPKVLPPRGTRKHGVLATRSPHRPNPIGLSAVTIERVEGLVVRVRGLDLIDGTPVLDLKPYVAYADAFPAAAAGWLASDPKPSWTVHFASPARARLEWLRERGIVLEAAIASALALGPEPHPYRRIRSRGSGLTIALKEWRADFTVDGHVLVVSTLRTGYRARQIATDAGLEVHRSFVATFG